MPPESPPPTLQLAIVRIQAKTLLQKLSIYSSEHPMAHFTKSWLYSCIEPPSPHFEIAVPPPESGVQADLSLEEQ